MLAGGGASAQEVADRRTTNFWSVAKAWAGRARDETHAAQIERGLRRHALVPFLYADLAPRAVRNYRKLRKLGVTIRKTPDIIIATFCIEHRHALCTTTGISRRWGNISASCLREEALGQSQDNAAQVFSGQKVDDARCRNGFGQFPGTTMLSADGRDVVEALEARSLAGQYGFDAPEALGKKGLWGRCFARGS